MYPCPMAVTLQTRAGSSLRFHVRYWLPDKTALVNTTGHTARLQVRGTQRPRRVLLDTKASAEAGATLELVEPGHWLVYLGGSMTRSFPSTVTFEVDLVNDLDADDSTNVVNGAIYVTPEGVTND